MIIGVSGKIKSGKNEFYAHLSKLMALDGISCGEFSFAYPLKKMTANLFGIEYDPTKDREFKEDLFVCLNDFQVYNRADIFENPENCCILKDSETIRYVYDKHSIEEFISDWENGGLREEVNNSIIKADVLISMRIWLQYFGTNVCRSFVDKTWVNSTMRSIDITKNLVCTDVRFPNEANSILKKDGILIRIVRAECNGRRDEHVSETALDNYDSFTHIITNNGTLEEFHKSIEDFYKSIKNNLK